VHCQNSTQLLLDLFNLFDLRLILTLLYDSLNLVTNAFSSARSFRGAWFRRKEVQSAVAVALCCIQNISALSSGFPLLQRNAEAVNRWGGKTKDRLISYFISNTSAENYRNRVVICKFVNFGSLFLSVERMKLEFSNLTLSGKLIIASISLRITKHSQRGHQRHMTHLNLWS